MLVRRQALSAFERRKKSGLIREKIKTSPWFKKSRHILFYYPVKGEVDLRPLFQTGSLKKRFYLPTIADEKTFQALPFTSFKTLKKGKQRIPEPQGGIPAKKLDLILVPGVAFDERGNRLGTGRGYYDRFLKRYPRAFKLGVAYREQKVEKIPRGPYDVVMDQVLTD